MNEVSNEIEFEDLMNKGTSEFSYADIQWLKGYAHTFYLQLEDIKIELIGQDKYIEKLKKEYANQLQQKENIIKEVRECLNKNRVYIAGERNLSFEIEQILDKENK